MEDGAVTDRPATVTEAFARDAGSQPAAPVETEPVAEVASADAIVPPATETPTAQPSSDERGPLPFERHKAILDGAYKERDQYKSQLDGWKDYEWVRGIPPTEFREAVTKVQRAASDPVGFFQDLYADLANHPTHAQQLRSVAAKMLGSGRTSKEADLSPDVEITDGQGQVVGRTFSAERVQALMQRAVQDALTKEVGPIKSEFEQRRAKQQADEAHARQNAEVDRLEASIKKLVGDDEESLRKVGELLAQNPTLDPYDAAVEVFNSHVRPKLTTQAKSDELDSLKRKAAASGINPATAVVAQKIRPKSLTDPGLSW